MKKIFKYNNYIYVVVHIFIGLDVFNRTKENLNSFLIFMGLFLIIAFNNYLRQEYFYKDRNKYFLSIFIFMILSSVLIYNVGGYVDIFSFIIIYELILFTEGKLSRTLIILAISNTLFLTISRNLSLKEILDIGFWQDNYIDAIIELIMFFLYLSSFSLILFGYKALRKEKRKVDKLNKELELSYTKLMEQSKKIEELTITKERNRVAGEIHDNLGHSLVALNMNLDVAEKMVDKDMEKTKELLNKAKALSKESMDSLRKAVYALKEERPTTLTEKLKSIVYNIQSTDKIQIILNIDERIESLPLENKEIIYTSIKEGVTNSIKHGKGNKLNIDIKVDKENKKISIKDNGLGCNDLVKGNGLLGIENRVSSIGGVVNYNIGEKEGFEMEIII